MNVVIIYCLLSIILWIAIIFCIKDKSKDNLHPIIILLLFYMLNYPIKMVATKCGIFLIDSNAFGEEKQIFALALSDLSMFILCVMFSIKARFKDDLNKRLWPDTYDFSNASVFFLFLFIFCGWLAYGVDSIFRMFSLSAMMEFRAYRSATRSGGISGLLSTVMNISIYAFIYLSIRKNYKKSLRKKIIFLTEVLLLTWYYYAQTLAKTTLLMTPLIIIVSYQMCSKRNGDKGISLKFVGIVGSVGLLAIAIMELTDILAVRAVSGSRGRALLNSFFNPSFDAPDNLTAIIDRIDNMWLGQLGFRPFFYNLFLSKIPRTIWTGKSPINGKIMIVENLLPEFFVSTTNYNAASPSIVGDALASGGVLLVIILSAVYGILFYNIYISARSSDNLISNLLYLFFVSNLNNFCRGGSDFLGNLIYYYALICIICILYKMFNKIRIITRSQT